MTLWENSLQAEHAKDTQLKNTIAPEETLQRVNELEIILIQHQ